MIHVTWDIRRDGRAWSTDEAELRSCYVIPDRPEIHHGKLYFTDEERLAVAACLIENLGLDKVVRSLGSLELWNESIKAAKAKKGLTETLDSQKTPTVRAAEPDESMPALSALAEAYEALERASEAAAAAHLRQLERLDPEVATHVIHVFDDRSDAARWLSQAHPELGGVSPLRSLAQGQRQSVLDILDRILHGLPV